MRWLHGLAIGLVTCVPGCAKQVVCTDCLPRGPTVSLGPSSATLTEIAANTFSLDFGAVAVGRQIDVSLGLANDGTSPESVLSVTPPDDAEFSLGSLPTSIEGGNVATIPLSFKPFSTGQKNATLTLHTDSPTLPSLTIFLTGTGVNAQLVVSPTALDFGAVVAGRLKLLSVAVTNDAAVPLTVASQYECTSASCPYSLDPSSLALPAHATQMLSIGYAPTVPGSGNVPDTASLVLTSSAGESATVHIQGYAVGGGPAIACTPTNLSFGTVTVDSTVVLSLTCINSGSDVSTDGAIDPQAELNFAPGTPLQTSDPAFSARFHLANGSRSLKAGESTQVDVSYGPSAVGADTGTLSIFTNAVAPSGPTVIPLTGQGG